MYEKSKPVNPFLNIKDLNNQNRLFQIKNMSLNHEFLFVSKKRYSDDLWSQMVWDKKGFNAKKSNIGHFVEVYDDTLRYFHDFLIWLPVYNPAQKKEQFGLNYYGPTVIRENHLENFKKLIESLHGLFENAPDTFDLTGSRIVDEDDSYYEVMPFTKKEILLLFKQLLEITNLAINKKGSVYILGI